MRNIRELIARYSTFLLFLVLQIFSLLMLSQFNMYHESILSNIYNEWAGTVNTRYNKVETYFSLRQQNEELVRQNTELLNQLRSNFESPDTASLKALDTVQEKSRRFLFLPAKVISNSVSERKNYIMLHRGSGQGVEVNMSVVSPAGVVGTVVSVSENMCMVMSLLHMQSKIIAVLKKGSGFGEISWDGMDPRYLQLAKVPKTVVVKKGDTVVTSRYSDKYPPDYTIGYVDAFSEDQATSTYNLRIRTAVDFQSLQYAFVVRNLQSAEMEAIRKKTLEEDHE